MEKKLVDISWATLWRIFLFGLFILVLTIGKNILLGLFLAIAIASGLEFIISFLEKHKFPRTLAVFLVFFFGALLVAAFIYLIIPFIIADLSLVIASLGDTPIGDWLAGVSGGDNTFLSWVNRISTQVFAGEFGALNRFQGVLGGIGLAVTIFVIAFYLSISRGGVERFVRAIVPEESEQEVLHLYARSMEKISFWFRTQLVLSFLVGVLVWVTLFFLGVRHAFLLGVLTAVFEIVPFVGPIVAGATAVLFAFVTSPTLALYTAIAFLLVQQVESNFLVPLVTRKTVGLHPVVVIVSLLIGIEAAGLLGALVAIPAAAVFQEILEERSLRRPRSG